MKNEILLTYVAIGPTFRDRLLYNVLNGLESYLLVDLLILTDIVDDFNALSKYPNIKVQNYNDLRQDYPWSLEYEALPMATKDEKEYVDDIRLNQIRISGCLWRFVLLMEGIEAYKAIFFINCDVFFKLPPDQYNAFIQSLEFDTEDSAVGHGHVLRASEFGHTAKFIAEQNQMPYLENLMNSNDGNLFGYCFKNKAKLKQLFEMMNNIVYKALVEKDPNYFFLGPHGVWGANNEPIQAIAYSLLNITSYPGHSLLYSAFAINTYPEDRFWNWPHIFQTSQISKQDFINLNYDNLKQFYADRNQPWSYN
jgi:hypothetical protein